MTVTKTELVAAKSGGLLEGLKSLGSFAAQTFIQYQTAKAQPATVVPAPAPTPTSSSSSGSRLPPVLVIGGAVVLGAIILRRR